MLFQGLVLGLLALAASALYLPGIGGANSGHGALLGHLLGTDCDDGTLCVRYLDVGQGDATFIESPSGTQVLIDGGPDSSVLRELSRAMGFFDKTIDVLIATHPDSDHIGGLTDVLQRYEVGTVLMTENESETPVAGLFLDLVEAEGAEVRYVRNGDEFLLGEGSAGGVILNILFPDRDPTNFESNTSSIVAMLKYGDTDFIFTGDSPQSVETYLTELYGSGLAVEVLKVGHHGSKTSTAETFISAVDPDLAIISAGKDNRYGHPHLETLDTLREKDIPIVSTAEEDTITIQSDGIDVVQKF